MTFTPIELALFHLLGQLGIFFLSFHFEYPPRLQLIIQASTAEIMRAYRFLLTDGSTVISILTPLVEELKFDFAPFPIKDSFAIMISVTPNGRGERHYR
ncbi:MAG: hypothetical protein CM15mP49_16570 [Actinomycetota bacterium]|nr:MAG: hypothetical protein CM15mP49_16570 [Actinomycetota bacterium]